MFVSAAAWSFAAQFTDAAAQLAFMWISIFFWSQKNTDKEMLFRDLTEKEMVELHSRKQKAVAVFLIILHQR